MRWRNWHMYKCLQAVRVMWANLWLSSDNIFGHQKSRKNFLIIYLRHIYYLPITRPSCLLGEERRLDSRTLKRQKWSLDLLVLERSRSRFFENNGLITTGYEVRMGCFPHCVYLLWNDLICLLYTLIVSSSFIRAYGMALTEQIYNTPYWPVLLNHNSNVAPKPTGLKR